MQWASHSLQDTWSSCHQISQSLVVAEGGMGFTAPEILETGTLASCELGDRGFGWAATASMTSAPRVMASWTDTSVPFLPLTHLRIATLCLILNPLGPTA